MNSINNIEAEVDYREQEINWERIVEGYRDYGYEITTSIADLVDNSIDADAKNILIDFGLNYEGQVTFSLLDDGDGMNYDELSNALTYGSNDKTIGGKSKYNLKSSLGKYGLGLKTASTAFCRKITMLTKKKRRGIY